MAGVAVDPEPAVPPGVGGPGRDKREPTMLNALRGPAAPALPPGASEVNGKSALVADPGPPCRAGPGGPLCTTVSRVPEPVLAVTSISPAGARPVFSSRPIEKAGKSAGLCVTRVGPRSLGDGRRPLPAILSFEIFRRFPVGPTPSGSAMISLAGREASSEFERSALVAYTTNRGGGPILPKFVMVVSCPRLLRPGDPRTVVSVPGCPPSDRTGWFPGAAPEAATEAPPPSRAISRRAGAPCRRPGETRDALGPPC